MTIETEDATERKSAPITPNWNLAISPIFFIFIFIWGRREIINFYIENKIMIWVCSNCAISTTFIMEMENLEELGALKNKEIINKKLYLSELMRVIQNLEEV